MSRFDEEKQRLNAEITEAKESFAKNQSQLDRLDAELNILQQNLNDFELEFSEKKRLEMKSPLNYKSKNQKELSFQKGNQIIVNIMMRWCTNSNACNKSRFIYSSN